MILGQEFCKKLLQNLKKQISLNYGDSGICQMMVFGRIMSHVKINISHCSSYMQLFIKKIFRHQSLFTQVVHE